MKFVTAANFTQPQHAAYSPDSDYNIHPTFVISRRADNSILSRYEDEAWDLSPYSSKRYIFSFTSWAKNTSENKGFLVYQLAEEARLLLWHMMFKPIGKCLRKKPTGFVVWFTQLRRILLMAFHLGLTLSQCATDPRFRIALRSSITQENGRKTLEAIHGLLKDALSIHVQYRTSCPQMILRPEELSDYGALILSKRKHCDSSKRTPLIPSRIMANVVHQSLKCITELYPHKEKLLALSKRYWNEPTFFCVSYYVSQSRGGSRSTKQTLISPEQALAEYGLTDVVKIDTAQPKSITRLKSWLLNYLSMARLLVLAFTGMRDHEVRIMSHDCFERVEIPGIGSIPLIKSYTSKLELDNYSEVPKYWATSNDIENVIEFARTLSLCQILFQTTGEFNTDNYDPKCIPLWATSNSGSTPPLHFDLNYVYSSLWLSRLFLTDAIAAPDSLTITDSDRSELEVFDAFYEWDEEKFDVGRLWPFATHQFRRSVAVYASRSGMVSLPSLGTQYKHLSLTMAQLYSENSAFSEHFIRDEYGSITQEHAVVDLFDYAKALNKSIALEENVIRAANKLSGARGAAIQRLKDKGELEKFLGDRDEIARKIYSGELSYVETDVGGCMRKTMCSQYGVSLVVPCVSGCEDAVIGGDGGKKLRDYKESLIFSLDDLDKGSRPYHSLKKEIDLINIKLIQIDREDMNK